MTTTTNTTPIGNRKLNVIIDLSPVGQKWALAHGRTGQRWLVEQIPLTSALLEHASITEDGDAWLSLAGSLSGSPFNHLAGEVEKFRDVWLEEVDWSGSQPEVRRSSDASDYQLDYVPEPLEDYLLSRQAASAQWRDDILATGREARIALEREVARWYLDERPETMCWLHDDETAIQLKEREHISQNGSSLMLKFRVLPATQLEALRVEIQARQAERDARRAAEQAARDAESAERLAKDEAERAMERRRVRDWVAKHGSERLKLAAITGQLEKSSGVYYTERLQLVGEQLRADLAEAEVWPRAEEWCWASQINEESEVINPSQRTLRAYAVIKDHTGRRRSRGKEFLESRVAKVRTKSQPDSWVPAIAVKLPWRPDTWAYCIVSPGSV